MSHPDIPVPSVVLGRTLLHLQRMQEYLRIVNPEDASAANANAEVLGALSPHVTLLTEGEHLGRVPIGEIVVALHGPDVLLKSADGWHVRYTDEVLTTQMAIARGILPAVVEGFVSLR